MPRALSRTLPSRGYGRGAGRHRCRLAAAFVHLNTPVTFVRLWEPLRLRALFFHLHEYNEADPGEHADNGDSPPAAVSNYHWDSAAIGVTDARIPLLYESTMRR